jgi:hypothetical protein
MSPNTTDSPSILLVVAAPAPEKALAMLSGWAWLVPARIRAVGVNRFGDWYLETPDGTVSLLSIWEGTFAPVALSIDEWREWLATEDGIETNWGELVTLLYDRGRVLGDEECFAFVPPPIGGVGIDVDRIMTMPISAITSTMAQTFKQLGGGQR